MSWAGRAGLPSLLAHGFAGQLLVSPLRASDPRRIPFPLAHGFAESREAKAYAAGLTARACQRVLAHRLVCAPPLMGAARFAWGPCLHTFRQAFGQLLVSWRASGRAKDHPIKKLKESAGRGVVEVFDSFCQQETLQLLLRIALPWPWWCGMLGASVECSDFGGQHGSVS